jgi:aromatic ring-opening dioxygenase LigB subunit
VCKLVRKDALRGLLDVPAEMVEQAKADSWWQMLMLLGATGDGWQGRLISYEAPTYFGMLTAAYEPSRDTASRPRTRSRPRTPAR